MDLREQVIKAQRQLIDRLAACEETISTLYAVYSKAFPALADFWLDLSRQEAAHAKLLQMLHKHLDKGSIFQNLARFDKGSIDAFLAQTEAALGDVDKGSVPQDAALAMAMTLETSFLDAHFFDIVQSDSEEYRIVAAQLSKATQQHQGIVKAKWLEMRSDQRGCADAEHSQTTRFGRR